NLQRYFGKRTDYMPAVWKFRRRQGAASQRGMLYTALNLRCSAEQITGQISVTPVAYDKDDYTLIQFLSQPDRGRSGASTAHPCEDGLCLCQFSGHGSRFTFRYIHYPIYTGCVKYFRKVCFGPA